MLTAALAGTIFGAPPPVDAQGVNAAAAPIPLNVRSTDILRRYLEDLSARHKLPPPSAMLITRQELGQYFLQLMHKLSELPPESLSVQDYQDIGMLTDEFEDTMQVVKGRLAMQVFRNQTPQTAAAAGELNARVNDHDERLKIMEKIKISGDMTFAPQSDFGRGVRDEMAANFRGRLNFIAKVNEPTADSRLGEGFVVSRLTAAAGRFFPRNKYLLAAENDIVDAVASPYNSGINEVQVPDLFINNNNSNSVRPTVSLEQLYYAQDIRVAPKWKGHFRIGNQNFANTFDTNVFANNEAMQFLNTSFVNNISWRNNFIGPSWLTSVERSLFRDKAFLRGSAGMITLTNRDFFGGYGGNYELMFGHTFKNKPGNYRAGFWNFNFRGGSANPFVTPIDISGTSVLAQIPGGVTTPSKPTGFYISCDQKIWKNIGIWGRYALNDKQIGQVLLGGLLSSRQSWSTGIEIPASIIFKKRPHDVLGIAYGQVSPYSREAVTPATPAFVRINGVRPTTLAQVNANVATFDTGAHHRNEKILEAYYRYHINQNVSISPDVQYYWSPGGTGPQPGVFVLGSRLQLNF